MHNELWKIGPFTMYGYGTMIGIGILCAYFLTEYRARKYKLAYEHIFYLVIWSVLGGFLGAKLLFLLTEWKNILQEPGEFLYYLTDGFVVYGGILGGILSGWLYCRKANLEFLKYFDLVMPAVALAQGFGRIGCFLAGCCYGRETHHAPSVIFRISEFAPNGIPLIPTQLYSSVLDFLLFGLLLWIAKRKIRDGQVAAAYLSFYSSGRFLLEFFRGDAERGTIGFLSTSQFIAVFTGAAGVLLFLSPGFRRKRNI